MAQFRVLVTDYAWPDLSVEREVLAEIGAELVVAPAEEAAVVACAATVDAILTCWRQVPIDALQAAHKCRIVSRYGIGLDNIPVQEATQLGILVTNVPDYCLDEVSDHTMALLLASARHIVGFAVSGSQGVWQLDSGQHMRRIRGQMLGLVGYGRVAREVAKKAQAFGLQVVAYTPRLRAKDVETGVAVAQNLAELLHRSDYLSLHVPLTAETTGMIGATEFEAMKPTAYLINTSRGAVIDELALVAALTTGQIAGAAIDVLTEEPPASGNALLHLDKVISTPHAAFFSQEAIHELASRAARHVVAVLQGEEPPCLVNPGVLGQSNCRLEQNRTS